jgi:xylose dehydrogenase (NAD/NADP)
MTRNDRIRFGFLSTANINRLVLAGAHESDQVEVVAVGSRDEARADAYAREHGIPRAHGSYEALLADSDVDAIYISLPNSMHVEWSIKALEAGKHVLCEKPFDKDPAEVERAFDAAERADRLLMEAFMWRHNPQTKRLQELVAEGAVGTLRLVRASFGFALDDTSNIRLRADVDGGSLMDVGCYCVSGSRLLGGEPERVLGEQVVGETGVDVRMAATLRFPGEVVAQFDSALDVASRDELEVIGSEASLFLDDPWHCREPGIELRRDGRVERVEVERVNSYRLELENLAAAIRGEGEPLLGRDDAVGQARTIDALYRSASSGEAVKL